MNICVVTGGGSGMGLSTAKLLGEDHYVIISGRTPSKLEGALSELQSAGVKAEVFPGDVSDRDSVRALARHAAKLGTVKTVVHAAGMSPHMASAETILKVNALGTINVNEEFAQVMSSGSCIIDFSSMSAYMLPEEQLPLGLYPQSVTDPEGFVAAITGILNGLNETAAPGAAYVFSKNFVIWFARHSAVVLGKKGIRVLSVSPGTFETPMGILEGESASSVALNGALGRLGRPEEMAELVRFVASDKASYLTGTDILCDGGAVAAIKASRG